MNATWMQLTSHRNVIFCSGRLSDVSAVKIKCGPFHASKTDQTFPFASNSFL